MSLPPPQSTLTRREAERLVAQAVDAGRLERAPAERLGAGLADAGRARGRARRRLREQAARQGRRSSASRATSSSRSPTCAATAAPTAPSRSSPDDAGREDLHARRGRRGDARRRARGLHRGALLPRRQARDRLPRATASGSRSAGYATTAEYLVQACEVAFAAGMLPHTNAGILSRGGDGAAARVERVDGADARERRARGCASAAARTTTAPDKDPAVRLRMHEEAGELRHPVHERDPARHRRERRRARRHAARDPRPRTTATATSRK